MFYAIWTTIGMYLLGVIAINELIEDAANKDELDEWDLNPALLALQWPLIAVVAIYYRLTNKKDEDE